MGAVQSLMGADTPFYTASMKAFFEDKDLDAVAALYTDDCEWVWHSSGKTMGKEAFLGMMPGFMKMPRPQKQRCVYENAEICVTHQFTRFPNGDVEATMMVQKLRDGKCCKVETGSTAIPQDSPNYIAE